MLGKLLTYRKQRGTGAFVRLVLGILVDLLRGLRHGYWLVFVGKGVKIRSGKNLKIGRFTRIEDWCEIDAFGTEGVHLGYNCKIGRYSILRVPGTLADCGAGIKIGAHSTFAEFCFVGGAGLVQIGDNNSFGQYVSIHPQNHILSDGSFKSKTVEQGVTIGSNNWIGAKATFLDGAVVGDHCTVGAAALVNNQFGSQETIVGVPGRALKRT